VAKLMDLKFNIFYRVLVKSVLDTSTSMIKI